MTEIKQYSERDAMELDEVGGYYFRHVLAMTAEGLHSKSDIAAELGWRDMQIAALQEQVRALAGEPVAWVCGDEEIRDFKAGREVTIVRDCDDSDLEYLPLYTAAQPAVLPPEMETPSAKMTYTRGHADGWNDCRSAMMALGAQQQKVVDLDNVFSVSVTGVPVRVVLLKDVSNSLDAANVKWEVKK